MEDNRDNREQEYEHEHEHEPLNSQVVPVAMHSNILRMLYELRVPLYQLGAVGGGGGGGGEYVDDMEQAAVAVLARSLYDARPVKHVIDIADGENDGKHGIREMTYDPDTAEEFKINTACGIWQEEFEKGEAIKVLPCNHAFQAEAITKWLTTEKAECPICRFKLESKEVILHHEGEGDMLRRIGNDSDTDNNDDDDDDDAPQHRPHHHHHHHLPPSVDEQRARENIIMNRANNRIHNRVHAEGAADIGRDAYYGISMPMSRLIQMRSGLVNGSSASARYGGGARASLYPLSSQPQPSQASHPPPVATNINNYYINQINYYHHSSVEEQEEADIEEAIRRSLN